METVVHEHLADLSGGSDWAASVMANDREFITGLIVGVAMWIAVGAVAMFFWLRAQG